MGRAFWILDDVSPLRQIAASITKPTRTRPTDNPAQAARADQGRPLRVGAESRDRVGAELAPGASVKLQVWRNHAAQDVEIKLGKMEETRVAANATGATSEVTPCTWTRS